MNNINHLAIFARHASGSYISSEIQVHGQQKHIFLCQLQMVSKHCIKVLSNVSNAKNFNNARKLLTMRLT